MRPGLSVCMIVRDEEALLAGALRSVAGVADEIVVVDTGSTDRTVEIAREFGAVVLEREWRNDFAWARNEALARASYRWILNLDADEELAASSIPVLAQLKQSQAQQTGVMVRIYSRVQDYTSDGVMSNALVRIFPNDPAIRYRGAIHEYPSLNGTAVGVHAVISTIALMHHGYADDVVARKNKGQRNLAISVAEVERDPGDAYNWFNLGATHLLVGDPAQARAALERALEILGDRPRGFVPTALNMLAEIYAAYDRDPVRAEQAARRSLTYAPHHPDAHFQLGKALIAQRRLDEARDALLAAIENWPHAAAQFVVDEQICRWKAQAEIARTYSLAGDDESAAPWLELALREAPAAKAILENYKHLSKRLAHLALACGRREEALSRLARVAEIGSPEASEAALLLAGLLRDANRPRAGVAVIDRMLGARPHDAGLWLARATLFASLGESAEQERSLVQAFEAEPQRAALPLSAYYLEAGRLEDAAAVAARALPGPG